MPPKVAYKLKTFGNKQAISSGKARTNILKNQPMIPPFDIFPFSSILKDKVNK